MSHVNSAGTDNHIWRLGSTLAIRMPKVDWAAESVARECEFLPRFRGLPLAIPNVAARGMPDEGYPYVWSVCEWIEGEAERFDTLNDPVQAARDLAEFILAMRTRDTTGGPVSGPGNNLRGGPLAPRDRHTRKAIANLAHEIDAPRAIGMWDAALAAPTSENSDAWIHSDLKEGNLLMRDGRLAAVIDFGMLAVGDEAVDLTPAWSCFEGPARIAFLAALDPGSACVARAKGWTLSIAAITWAYYRDKNPTLTQISQQTLHRLLSE
ncbi:MAG: aminoglycoside phosphotransferase family protein [Alphaproteobacteria bacterium]|nr:aminoglycoside phosphotransferase family protein [Alphaproteobacteria bacterium]